MSAHGRASSIAVGLSELLAVARQAGDAIMQIYSSGVPVAMSQKADHSPLTQADLAAHRLLTQQLPRLLPGSVVISEESAADEPATLAQLKGLERYWLVDPLDGTRDFLARTGDFTVNIALMEHGRAVMGALVAPARGYGFVAVQGGGAFKQGAVGLPFLKIRCRQAQAKSFTCLVSRLHQAGEKEKLLVKFPEAIIKEVGSALKYGLIAAGEADFSVRKTPTSWWDTAAAQCILEEAGGTLCDFAGAPLGYLGDSLRNPPFLAIGDANLPRREILAALG